MKMKIKKINQIDIEKLFHSYIFIIINILYFVKKLFLKHEKKNLKSIILIN